ncbi:MAG: hypothetical protein PHT99_06950 [Methanoregula sp.]|nr:hypothetical protein [Methanoregula sp.]
MKAKPREKRPAFSVTHNDESMAELVRETDHKTLAVWALDCAERVLPGFEEKYPDDPRPRNAIDVLRAWITTGAFRMADIRKAALFAHAAARETGDDNAARSAARAAGQAVATAHVPSHSLGAAHYARQAVWRTADLIESDFAVAKERDWQYRHLLALRNPSESQN